MVRRWTPPFEFFLKLSCLDRRSGRERGRRDVCKPRSRGPDESSTTAAAGGDSRQFLLPLSLSRGVLWNSPHPRARSDALGEISSGHIPMPKVPIDKRDAAGPLLVMRSPTPSRRRRSLLTPSPLFSLSLFCSLRSHQLSSSPSTLISTSSVPQAPPKGKKPAPAPAAVRKVSRTQDDEPSAW